MITGRSITISVVYRGQTININEKSQLGLVGTLTNAPSRGSSPYLAPAYCCQAGIVRSSHFSGKARNLDFYMKSYF